ncbi:hypothetical protein [Vibrio sp. 99-8-1]|uniref:hypothetical protein n=1 Tax=Vibrio sp. 99-8-1 TaxID=2607602 RepID=UPI001493BD0C|nr:hypothetical protein [Vibrio sp. 99-8-1]NOI67789.1 hypothetical protein [Vibrio sp. 99-8-1]
MKNARRPNLNIPKSLKRTELVELVAKAYSFFESFDPKGITKQDTYKIADNFVSVKTKEIGNWQPTLKFFRSEWAPEQQALIDALIPPKQQGGKRTGAGRKKGIKTTVIRVPVEIEDLIKHLTYIYKKYPKKRSTLIKNIKRCFALVTPS